MENLKAMDVEAKVCCSILKCVCWSVLVVHVLG